MSELKLQQCRLDGRYDILDCLGRGSYAEIYVARDISATDGSPQMVVIKALNTALQGEPDAELERTLLDNFRNEAMALDRVRHPHIISRLGHGTALDLHNRTFHYLVLEYLPGGDLQALCRNHPLSLQQTLDYFEQVAEGLAYAHEEHVIHRDVKPSNLLLTADHSTVKIADFGVAKIEAAEGAITRVGTDVYAAPEHHPLMHTGPLDAAQLTRPKAQLTPAADVYSLAKTVYMLLTGEAPRRFSQRPITELPPSIAHEPWAGYVLRVIRRATETNAADRYQSITQFRDELRDATLPRTQLLSGSGGDGATMTRTQQARSTDTPNSSRRNFQAASAPPPVSFDAHARVNQSAAHPPVMRPRIVVPVAETASVARELQTPARHQEQVRPAGQTAPPVYGAVDYAPRTGLSGRTRRWLVALLLIFAFAVMLLATHNYVRGLRGTTSTTSSRPRNQPQRQADNSPAQIGGEYVAFTDVNLRSSASERSPLVGRMGRESRVRLLSVIGNWYEVEVLERQTPVEDMPSAMRGWVNRKYLNPR